VTAETYNSTSVTYGYNAASELTSAGTLTYGYDIAGNRTNTGFSTGTENQLLTDDCSGNMLDTITYDASSLVRQSFISTICDAIQ
jgi:hypothetical protein